MSPRTLKRAFLDHLLYTRSKTPRSATPLDVYFALAYTARDRLVRRWLATQRHYHQADPKRVYYLSAEFLLGRLLTHNLMNLGVYDLAVKQFKRYGIDLANLFEYEPDPGLGNGGLGRLAACFLDSMATMALPGMGYGIRYEFGIFRQEIEDGRQVEHPDDWLRYGNPWEITRPEFSVKVRFGGHVEHTVDPDGREGWQWVGGQQVIGVPYDTPIAGYGVDNVNTLRLWAARASEQFDLQVFNDGDYRRAVEEKALSESISKVLYPKDHSREGRALRLKQQYFFVCCSIQDIMRRYKRNHEGFDAFPDKVAIQMNDTHPAITVAELMRVLVDNEKLTWERAWDITRRSCAYTNHTLLPEALERWPIDLFEELLPRHLQVIYEINHRFLREVHIFAPGDDARKQRMSIIQEGQPRSVRMAHLAVIGSHKINGVAALHSELLKTKVLRDFAELWPDRFINKTNGVTPRRWLWQCNPRLSAAITERIGDSWITKLDDLAQLSKYSDDPVFHAQLSAIKRDNKRELAAIVKKTNGVNLNVDSLFDVQVKRIHEYKRQLLNCLHAITMYRRIKFGGLRDFVPRTIIVGGKAAPGYELAKRHIALIHDVGEIINNDPSIGDRLKCLFVPNYNVSFAERIIPATDLSEQISLAGKEASGTGNMKFQMNGALTIGTLDGANVEIREEVGADNFFLFGMSTEEVEQRRQRGYHPGEYIARSDDLRAAIELIEGGYFAPEDPHRHREVTENLRNIDPYLICADFDDYIACQDRVSAAYLDQPRWLSMVVENIAHSGKFSSDRTIDEYAREIWDVKPEPVDASGRLY
ncbi:MAG: glycogen/starch/alpha-glucan phosphorylase [Haliangiales bacterium]